MTDIQRIPERPGLPGAGRLGRHIQHDPRSRRFAFVTASLSVRPVRHLRNVPVFDQGEIGSCTGNAGIGCLATDPLFGQLNPTHPVLNEDLAVKTYSLATTLDEDPDQYPPKDTGSTGLAACKALQKMGLILGYEHTFSLDDFLKALTLYPVMLGLNWYESFDRPDSSGLVKITKDAEVRGGHEVYADEIYLPSNKSAGAFVGMTNSWTSQWGAGGRFYVSVKDLERLLHEDGDATIPVPLSAPVTPTPTPAPSPVPVPVPVPSPVPSATADDIALWSDMQKWAKLKGLA